MADQSDARNALVSLMGTGMHRLLLRFGASVAQSQFRRAPQGWIFRAPTPWSFGPRPHYLVDEARKARIEMVVGAGNLVVYLLLILAVTWFALYPAAGVGLVSPPWKDHLLTFVLWCSLLAVPHNFYQCFALWPLLRNLPRTAEKITLVERLKPLAMYSSGFLIFAFLFLTAMLLFMAYGALTTRPWDVAAFVGVVALSWLVIFYGTVLWVKRRLSAQI